MHTDLLDRLTAAVARLWYRSESDKPFEVVQWPAISPSLTSGTLIRLTGDAAETPVHEVALEIFFAPLLVVQDWYGGEDTERAQRYCTLYQLLQRSLTDLHIFRVGSIEVTIYIIGKVPTGEIVGLRTVTVET